MAGPRDVHANEVHTRFLHPFRWALATTGNGTAPELEKFVARLLQERFRDQIVWERITSYTAGKSKRQREVYRAELHEHVANFLFPETASGCACVRLCDELVNTIFGVGLNARDSKGALEPWHLGPTAQVEVFLSPHRVGLLSIGLECQPAQPLRLEQAQDFNYHFAQQREALLYWLGKPHPSENVVKWEAIPTDARSRIRPAPEKDVQLPERLGAAGGWFNLVEFKNWLLAPFSDFGLAEPRRQFQIYSVVRCPQRSVLDAADQRDFWAAKVADIAQIHESGHAGTPPGAASVPCLLLNRCHWAAVSSLGAAHIVADQGVPFDEQRVPTVRDKYFMPFLLAIFQAHYYEDTAAQLSALSLRKSQPFDETCSDELSRGWLAFLEFDGQCNHTNISEREAVNRWYALAGTGMSVPAAHDRLSQVMRELDGFCRLRAAQESRDKLAATSEQAEQSLAAIKQTQEKIEWVEIFLVGVYSVYLIHYLGENFHFGDAYFPFASLRFDYVGCCLFGGTLLASVFAACLLQPWKKDRPRPHDSVKQNRLLPPSRPRLRLLVILVFIVALLATYIGVGIWLKQRAD
jgi:hypothetical protein